MNAHPSGHLSTETSGNAAAAVFEQEWLTYRKMVDNNYLFHRQAYAHLRDVLDRETTAPFAFLDIACGDAGATVTALRGTRVAAYHGIDLSRAALDLAGETLAALDCPIDLRQADFATALQDWRDPVDVAWIGLSLHHFRAEEKRALMREVRRIIGAGGLFLVYENASPDGEDRPAWLARWDAQRPSWAAYADAEWDTISAHVHACDFPETDRRWRDLAHQAGFRETELVYLCPTDLFRLYLFRG